MTITISPKIIESLGIPKDAREVTIEPIQSSDLLPEETLTEIVIAINDRYVSKRDLWWFQIRLLGAVVYRGLSPPFDELLKCSSTTVMAATTATCAVVPYGVVGPQTKIIIRSQSAQIVLFLHITRDLWEFDVTTNRPVFLKMVNSVCDSIQTAIDSGRHHYLVLLITGRFMSATGRADDMYEKIFDSGIEKINVKNFRKNLLEFFNFFPIFSNWKDCAFYDPIRLVPKTYPKWFSDNCESNTPSNVNYVKDSTICGTKYSSHQNTHQKDPPVTSCDTHILESINLALSHFSKHHLDRKLRYTGTQITLVTSNTGIIRAMDSGMVNVTRQRVARTACAIRVVSISPKPLITTKSPVIIFVDQRRIDCPWLWYSYYTSKFPISCDDIPGGHVRRFVRAIESAAATCTNIMHNFFYDPSVGNPPSSGKLKPPVKMSVGGRLVSRSTGTGIVQPVRKIILPREKRTDEEILDLAIVTPRLQRVAVEASLRAADIKPIDNWTVPGEGWKTFHDLIGTRLAMDMQLIDAANDSTIPAAGVDALANSFGVKVSRSSMRDSHIQRVFIKGEDKCVWMLNHLESGNIYVSRGFLGSGDSQPNTDTVPDDQITEFVYEYRIRHHRIHQELMVTSDADPVDIITCSDCQSEGNFFIEKRNFFIPSPLPWNMLDDVIANPYMHASLPSTVPHNLHLSRELMGMRWKFRSSIRTGLFALIPNDTGFTHQLPTGNGLTMGGIETLSAGGGLSGNLIASHFLSWQKKCEHFLNSQLPISVVPFTSKSSTTRGFVPVLVKRSGSDWFLLHMEPVFEYPRIFLFSIEWILCHSAIIESTIETIREYAIEDQFSLVRLPHAQLFPQPSSSNRFMPFDELVFGEKNSIKFPSSITNACILLMGNRILEKMDNFFLIFHSRDYTHPEGFSAGTTAAMVFSREPGWIFMSRDGFVFIAISMTKVDWILNHTFVNVSGERSRKAAIDFLILKQIIHTSIVDGGGAPQL